MEINNIGQAVKYKEEIDRIEKIIHHPGLSVRSNDTTVTFNVRETRDCYYEIREVLLRRKGELEALIEKL